MVEIYMGASIVLRPPPDCKFLGHNKSNGLKKYRARKQVEATLKPGYVTTLRVLVGITDVRATGGIG